MAIPLLEAALPAVIGGGASLISTALGGKLAEDAASTAWDRTKAGAEWQEYQYTRRFQNTVNDMKAAGLNPILAASGGFNASGTGIQAPVAQMARMPMPDFASSARDIASAGLQSEQTKNVAKDTELKANQIWETIAKTARERAAAGLMTQQEKEAFARVTMTWAQTRKANREAWLAEANAYKSDAERQLAEAKVKQVHQLTYKLKLEMEELKQTAKVYGSKFGFMLKAIAQMMDALNVNVGVGVGFTKPFLKHLMPK
jgi:hypothetical protein